MLEWLAKFALKMRSVELLCAILDLRSPLHLALPSSECVCVYIYIYIRAYIVICNIYIYICVCIYARFLYTYIQSLNAPESRATYFIPGGVLTLSPMSQRGRASNTAATGRWSLGFSWFGRPLAEAASSASSADDAWRTKRVT